MVNNRSDLTRGALDGGGRRSSSVLNLFLLLWYDFCSLNDGIVTPSFGGAVAGKSSKGSRKMLKCLFWSCLLLVAYSYLLYPVVLAAACRLQRLFRRQRPVAEPADWPAVTMVVAAYNEERVIREKIQNSLALDYPADRLRVVIASDCSSDRTNEIVAACDDPRIQLIGYTERRGKIGVLNATIPNLEDDLVIVSDANTMYAPKAVKNLVRHFTDERVGCVCGELVLEDANGGASGEGLYWKYETLLKRMESRLGFLLGATGGIFAIRRKLFRRLPAGTIVEDFVLPMKILEEGHRVCYEPAARATETTAPSMREEMRRKTRIGAGGFQAIGLTKAMLDPRRGMPALGYWSHKILRWCAPFLLLGAILTNLTLIAEPLYAAFLVAQLAGLVIGLQGLLPRSIDHRLVRPVRYFFLMNLALFIGFFRFLRGTQRVTWEQAARG
jgi:cellulose synthase/poly-beta-1,6-N-acetylglucosamine synthase-like glycosyltransferase